MDLKLRSGRREQGELIKSAATSAGLSLKDLATRLGVSHALIYQYVSGANLAQTDKLQEIAAITGMPIGFFFGEGPRSSQFDLATAHHPTLKSPSLNETESTPQVEPVSVTLHSASIDDPAMVEHSLKTDTVPTSADYLHEGIDGLRLRQLLRQLDQLATAQSSSNRDLAGLAHTLERMIDLVRISANPRLEADLLMRLGNALTDAGNLKGAVEALETSHSIYDALTLNDSTLAVAQSLARCYALTGQTDKAEALFKDIANSSVPDLVWRGRIGLGQTYEQQDRYSSALDEFEMAQTAVALLALDPVTSPIQPVAEVYVRTNLGNIFMAEGDFATASGYWSANLQSAEELSLPDQFLEALISQSVCNFSLGRPGQALDEIQRGVRLCRLMGDRERQAVSLAIQAEILSYAGLIDEGDVSAQNALQIAEQVGSTRAVTLAKLARARILAINGETRQALAIIEGLISIGHLKDEAAAQILAANALCQAGEFNAAMDRSRTVISRLKDIGAQALEMAAWLSLGAAAIQVKEVDTAVIAANKAEEMSRTTPGLPDSQWRLFALRGRIHRLSNQWESSAKMLLSAAQIIQRHRTDFLTHGLVEACLDDPNKLAVYREALETLRLAGDEETARQLIETASWPPLTE